MFYVYVLYSKKYDQFYTGSTSDLKKRLKEHNADKSEWTSHRRPWEVIYYEACLKESDARRREKYFKTTSGKRLLKRRLKDYFYQLNSTTG